MTNITLEIKYYNCRIYTTQITFLVYIKSFLVEMMGRLQEVT